MDEGHRRVKLTTYRSGEDVVGTAADQEAFAHFVVAELYRILRLT